MGKGQHPRITTVIVAQFETISDRITQAFADGVVTPDEEREITSLVKDGYQKAMEADDGVRIGVALIRGGRDADNVRRYASDRELVEIALA